jgi:acetyltransferase-like isoleucine patch superfamily enzyme
LYFLFTSHGGLNNKIKYKKFLTWKIKFKIKGSNNKIINYASSKNLTFEIAGNNNTIQIMDNSGLNNILFHIQGDYNTIIIHKNVDWSFLGEGGGRIWHENNYTFLEIGEGTTLVSVMFSLSEDNSKIIVGKDCMISNTVEIANGDGHAIVDMSTKKKINNARDIIIKDQVWIGSHVTILKGAIIEKNTVIGAGAIVTKGFNEENIIIAGIPGKIIKRGITWDRERD